MNRNVFETDFVVFYDRFINRISSIFFVDRWRKSMVYEAARILDSWRVVVDFCSGAGDVSSYVLGLKSSGVIVDCDLSMFLLEKARKRFGDSSIFFVRADNVAFPFKSEVADVVFTSFCLRHSSSAPRSVDEIFRVLREGGVWVDLEFFRGVKRGCSFRVFNLLFRSFINFNRLLVSRYSNELKWFFESIDGYFSYGEFSELVSRRGFDIKKARSFMGGMVFMTVAVKSSQYA